MRPWLLVLALALAGCVPGRTTARPAPHQPRPESTRASPSRPASGAASPDAGAAPAPDPGPAPRFDELEGTAARLARAFDAQLTTWTRPDGTPVHVGHCRGAPGGCRGRIAAMAQIIADAAREHDLDPFLLGAIAMRESALNPGVIGAAGEAGIVQLHPRGLGRSVRFVQDSQYRARCLARRDGCQGPVVRHAASQLGKAIRECGDLVTALGLYNSGHCSRRPGYVRDVLTERRKLRRLASRTRRSGAR